MASPDKLTVEVIKSAAIYASEEMGIVLRNTAYSPNIKDRLDHTCAVLTPEGDLVAQAEHIPVHIGSMTVGVKNIVSYLRSRGIELGEGDVIIANDPYITGTHLNDITLLKPVYYKGQHIAYLANKAHHVDVGGAVPGSLGGDVKELGQEGIIIPPVKLVTSGVINRDILDLIAANVRTPEYTLGDLRAQLASLNVGERRLRELAERYGGEILLQAWREILDYTERYVRRTIRDLGVRGEWTGEDYVELPGGDLKIRARLAIGDDEITIDFEGTSSQVDAPLNAVLGVTVAAASFAVKSILDPEMPVNQGFYRAIRIVAPEGTLVNPRKPAPVSAGNTETSQRIADTVFMALAKALPGRVPAASCGTMTNIMIGGLLEGRRWAFYETIGCGSGGRPWSDGVDGVHTNMTNTLNTPIERLEAEYPVLFKAYKLREDSEGPGQNRGGLGITRAFTLTRGTATLTIVAQRCRHRPWGLNGGKPAEPSTHYLVRPTGENVPLGCIATITVKEGDTIVINTPGGGGYGDPCTRNPDRVREDLENGKISETRAIKEYCAKNLGP
ncbi:MAG: hydantoinase B/oxoprolinase family protein [Desulfurococcales archaeon]|nr:hydantoinase B/oxoprolinase family protein [Desulfurococcales archaeon]